MNEKIDSPTISIIIPNLHSPILDQTVQSLLDQQTTHKFEIIIVGMDKYRFIETFDNVQFIHTNEPVGAAEARNIGINKAKGDWFLFIDSDCIATDGWLQAFSEEFEKGWKVIGGGIKTPKKPFWLLVYNLSMFYGTLASQDRSEKKFLPTLNLAVHREVIDCVGTMDETLLRGQDVDWTSRMTLAGYKLLFKPTASILHLPARKDLKTLQAYVRKSGYFMIRVRYKYPEIFRMPKILRHPFVWRVFAPFIALITSLKIIVNSKEVRSNLHIFPYLFLQKLSWCYGAAESLEELKFNES